MFLKQACIFCPLHSRVLPTSPSPLRGDNPSGGCPRSLRHLPASLKGAPIASARRRPRTSAPVRARTDTRGCPRRRQQRQRRRKEAARKEAGARPRQSARRGEARGRPQLRAYLLLQQVRRHRAGLGSSAAVRGCPRRLRDSASCRPPRPASCAAGEAGAELFKRGRALHAPASR